MVTVSTINIILGRMDAFGGMLSLLYEEIAAILPYAVLVQMPHDVETPYSCERDTEVAVCAAVRPVLIKIMIWLLVREIL